MENGRDEAPGVFPVEARRPSRFPVEDVAHRQALRLMFSFDGSQVPGYLRRDDGPVVPLITALHPAPGSRRGRPDFEREISVAMIKAR